MVTTTIPSRKPVFAIRTKQKAVIWGKVMVMISRQAPPQHNMATGITDLLVSGVLRKAAHGFSGSRFETKDSRDYKRWFRGFVLQVTESGFRGLPIGSIAVPFWGYVTLQDPKDKPQKGTTMEPMCKALGSWVEASEA